MMGINWVPKVVFGEKILNRTNLRIKLNLKIMKKIFKIAFVVMVMVFVFAPFIGQAQTVSYKNTMTESKRLAIASAIDSLRLQLASLMAQFQNLYGKSLR